LYITNIKKSVPFNIVRKAISYWSNEVWDECRINLAVTVHLHDNIIPIRKRSPEAGNHGAAYTLVYIMPQHSHTLVEAPLLNYIARMLWAAVVYSIYYRAFRSYPGNDVDNLPRYAEAWNNDSNPWTFEVANQPAPFRIHMV